MSDEAKVAEAADFDIEIARKRLERGTFASDEGVRAGREEISRMVAERLAPKPKPEYGSPVDKLLRGITVVTTRSHPPDAVEVRVFEDPQDPPDRAIFEAVRSCVGSVSIRTRDFPMLRAIDCRVSGGSLWWAIYTEVDDRDRPGVQIPVHFGCTCPLELAAGYRNVRDFALRSLRDSLRTVLQHELDECIYVAGARVFDPHVNDRPQRVPWDPLDFLINGVLR